MVKKEISNDGQVAYQIDGDDEKDIMQVKCLP